MSGIPDTRAEGDRLDALIKIEERHGITFTSAEIDSWRPLAEMERIAIERAKALSSIPAPFRVTAATSPE